MAIYNSMGLERIDGLVESIVYKSDRDAYTIAMLKDTGERSIKIVGMMPQKVIGQWVSVFGRWEEHYIYGTQFSFESCTPLRIDSSEDSAKFEEFKKKASKAIEQALEEAEQEATEAGMDGSESDQEELTVDDALLKELFRLNLSAATIKKLFKEYKSKTLSVIKTDPYRIAKDIKGIGFRKADEIAQRVGVQPESSERIEAGINFVLNENQSKGNIYMEQWMLLSEAVKCLELNREKIEGVLDTMALRGQVMREESPDPDRTVRVYIPNIYQIETNIAKNLCRICHSKTFSYDCYGDFSNCEEDFGIDLDSVQIEAIETAIENPVCVITGGPGTGKSTIIKILTDLLVEKGLEVNLAAPTGRAAKRMAELSEKEATTIHRLLKFEPTKNRENFRCNREDPLEADVVIIDEVSMVDEFLMYRLLDAIKSGTKLILIGDPDQLPSVGPGQVLSEIIDSNCVPVIRLNKVFRQKAGSIISEGAKMINSGQVPNDWNNPEFCFYSEANDEETLEFTIKYMKGLKNYDKINEVQVLSPFKNKPVGTANLNLHLQSILNPPGKEKEEVVIGKTVYREGDKIIQKRNDYEKEWTLDTETKHQKGKGVFNGDMGIIESIDADGKEMTISFFDGKRSTYSFGAVDEFSHAFALTIHKSQGSEYPCVIIPLTRGYSSFLTRRLLYTAITRGKRKVVIIGPREILYSMIANGRRNDRKTGLSEKINKYFTESSDFGNPVKRM